ncbi:Ribosome-binding ATPase YchF [uncultured archaeon]|nr:Ribosome-binding ATPase YchF [uncultured archaeon]
MIVGVVGKPNVGKSTLFKAMSMAEAEIANFPFTTIKPNVGVGYVRTPDAGVHFNVTAAARNSVVRAGVRFTPVKLIDVAGLVPGAHEGKGLGNQFLDDLSAADVLIHVVDASGRTNELGEPAADHDPKKDIAFLEEEIDLWFTGLVKKHWDKIKSRIKYDSGDIVKEFSAVLSGIKISEHHVKTTLLKMGREGTVDWSDDDVADFAVELRKMSKPIVLVANKADVPGADKHLPGLKEKYGIFPVSAASELALRQADKAGVIEYLPGDSDFKIKGTPDEKQKKALEFIRTGVLKKYGSTGVQQILNHAVFDMLKYMVVYPVENENALSDGQGNILPDSHLVPQGTTAIELAYRIHTDIGDKFIGAIDCKTKRRIGRDHVLADGDVVKIITHR